MVRAPARKAGDLGWNSGPGKNFSLLTTFVIVLQLLNFLTHLGGSPSSSSSPLYCSLQERASFRIFLPSKLQTAPVSDNVCPLSSECTATGAEHPPPRVRRKLLSARTRNVVVPWNNGSRSLRVVKSSSLHSIARAPCPTAYNKSSASSLYKYIITFHEDIK